MDNSKEHKFKVGDKVVAIENVDNYGNYYLHPQLRRGSVYEVTKVCNGIISVSGFFAEGNVENWSEDWFKPYEEKEVKVENTVTAESLRNSILSLQQERVSLQEKIEQNIAQEKSLTEQLKELGFLLVESKEQPTNVVEEKKSVLYAEEIEEDMSDPCNWKSGDVLEVIKNNINIRYWVGTKAKVVKTLENYIEFQFEDEYIVRNQELNFPGADFMKEYFKFHSRPVVN